MKHTPVWFLKNFKTAKFVQILIISRFALSVSQPEETNRRASFASLLLILINLLSFSSLKSELRNHFRNALRQSFAKFAANWSWSFHFTRSFTNLELNFLIQAPLIFPSKMPRVLLFYTYSTRKVSFLFLYSLIIKFIIKLKNEKFLIIFKPVIRSKWPVFSHSTKYSPCGQTDERIPWISALFIIRFSE